MPTAPVVASPALAASSLLTERQRQVQQLAARGLSTAQIATRLGITKRTAKQHIADGMNRLDLRPVQ